MKLRGWTSIDILKLDIEGAEYELFSENVEWLDCVKALAFEVSDGDRPGTLQLIFERLKKSEWSGSTCGECLVLIRQSLPWKPVRVIGIKPDLN